MNNISRNSIFNGFWNVTLWGFEHILNSTFKLCDNIFNSFPNVIMLLHLLILSKLILEQFQSRYHDKWKESIVIEWIYEVIAFYSKICENVQKTSCNSKWVILKVTADFIKCGKIKIRLARMLLVRSESLPVDRPLRNIFYRSNILQAAKKG